MKRFWSVYGPALQCLCGTVVVGFCIGLFFVYMHFLIKDGTDRMDAVARSAGYTVHRPNAWTCCYTK